MNKNMIVFSFININSNFKVVDILLTGYKDFDLLYANKVTKHLNDIEIFIISIDDLIDMTSRSSRDHVFSDVEMLKKIKK